MRAVRSLSSPCLQGCFQGGVSDALGSQDWMFLFVLGAATKLICLSCLFAKNMGGGCMRVGVRKKRDFFACRLYPLH